MFLQQAVAMFSANNDAWSEAQRKEVAKCTTSDPTLSPRGRAVFGYTCLWWTLFAQCDHQRERSGKLDTEAMERKAQHLSGNCPLSPKTLKKAFGMSKPSWIECGQGIYTGPNVSLRYEGEVSRLTCLLKGFAADDDTVDVDKLITHINSTIKPSDKSTSNTLEEIAGLDCLHTLPRNGQKYIGITAENLARCMADNGMYSCVRQEAGEMARNFPETCTLAA